MQVKCDQCNGWVHQICGNLNPKDVTDSFEYNCPECASNTDYMHSLEFDVIDVRTLYIAVANINFSLIDACICTNLKVVLWALSYF